MITPKQQKRTKFNNKAKQGLYSALVRIRNKNDAEEFLQDLLSSSEIQDIARRLLAAKMLYQRKTYRKIEDLIGMGPLTINKIHFKTKGSKVLRKILV